MCGIAGFIGDRLSNCYESSEVLDRMCRAITYRGPDDQGVYIKRNVALGMRRLAIIDVAGGRQPVCNEDGTVTAVFNGEIYNFQDLRTDLERRGHRFQSHSDTEVIVHAYEEFGTECVKHFRGMFAFAIWDDRFGTLILARDRVGKKPLHYTLAGNALVFGSEIKSLLQHPAVKREVNATSIAAYLGYGYVPDPETAFAGISKLPPGHLLTFQHGVVRVEQYWDFQYEPATASSRSMTLRDYTERLRELLDESVRIRLMSEVPLGAFLSGGIDSSTVVGMMARHMTQPVKTFSIGFTEGSHDELEYARITAKRFETDHHEFVVSPDICRIAEEIVWHHDEPFADVSSIPTYLVSKMAREHVTVALSGDGGDEVFAGYERYLRDRTKQVYDFLPSAIRRGAGLLSRRLPVGTYGKRYLHHLSLDANSRYVEGMCLFDSEGLRDVLSRDAAAAVREFDFYRDMTAMMRIPKSGERIDSLLYLDSKTYLPGDILTKVDRMSMANSLETRSPLLDHLLIEFVQTIPAQFKLNGHQTKFILKEAVRGLVPEEIINRKKHGFSVPIATWFKRELKGMVSDVLMDGTTRARGLFDERAVKRIFREHQEGRRDNSRHLWQLLVLELWYRTFIDREPAIHFSGAKHLRLTPLPSSTSVVREGHIS